MALSLSICPQPLRRVSVIGNSGAGKSTFARKLALKLDVPHLELDAINWQPGWTQLSRDDFRAAVSSHLESTQYAAGWVVDGNYGKGQDLVWDAADTIVWLDPPRYMSMLQLLWRCVVRTVTQQSLWGTGNVETWSQLLSTDPTRSVLAYAWQNYHRHRRRVQEQMCEVTHVQWVTLHSRLDTARFLEAVLAVAAGRVRSP
ncbi:uncharacterized protein EHS24_003948 [Apiotrichum porosum]|uniref:Adenylate kinase n=1 Tax=Apiotrichum porosum TaxID=105984 RepID=A0A427XE47_9TREE|nr:uncharacterized protein EHS24_003948 [Apiotrichum porosum]RSH77007.1 hypothetical protein EHS24_003948 [Apiotrichum porosum]